MKICLYFLTIFKHYKFFYGRTIYRFSFIYIYYFFLFSDFGTCDSSCDQGKKRGALGRLFRSLGPKKDREKGSPRHKCAKAQHQHQHQHHHHNQQQQQQLNVKYLADGESDDSVSFFCEWKLYNLFYNVSGNYRSAKYFLFFKCLKKISEIVQNQRLRAILKISLNIKSIKFCDFEKDICLSRELNSRSLR